MAVRIICPCMAAPKTNKRRCGEWCRMLEEALWDGHAVSGTGSTGNTASHSRQPRAPSQRRRHNDQEYDIIYYLQGGDMWHIGTASSSTGLYGFCSVTASLPLKCIPGNIIYLHSVYWVEIVYCTLYADTWYECSQWQSQDGLWLRQYAALPVFYGLTKH